VGHVQETSQRVIAIRSGCNRFSTASAKPKEIEALRLALSEVTRRIMDIVKGKGYPGEDQSGGNMHMSEAGKNSSKRIPRKEARQSAANQGKDWSTLSKKERKKFRKALNEPAPAMPNGTESPRTENSSKRVSRKEARQRAADQGKDWSTLPKKERKKVRKGLSEPAMPNSTVATHIEKALKRSRKLEARQSAAIQGKEWATLSKKDRNAFRRALRKAANRGLIIMAELKAVRSSLPTEQAKLSSGHTTNGKQN
jgi:hypothetical protein